MSSPDATLRVSTHRGYALIPAEILSYIFTLLLPSIDEWFDCQYAKLQLLPGNCLYGDVPTMSFSLTTSSSFVCRQWYDIYMNTPQLWAFIDGSQDASVFERFIENSKDVPTIFHAKSPVFRSFGSYQVIQSSRRWLAAYLHEDYPGSIFGPDDEDEEDEDNGLKETSNAAAPLDEKVDTEPRPLNLKMLRLNLIYAEEPKYHRNLLETFSFAWGSLTSLIIEEYQGHIVPVIDTLPLICNLDLFSFHLDKMRIMDVQQPPRVSNFGNDTIHASPIHLAPNVNRNTFN